MFTVNLQSIRQNQVRKKIQTVTIPGNLIDLVDYAQVERDHSEILNMMIEGTPYVLKTQYRQYFGKSRTYGNYLLQFLISRNFLGEGEYRGLKYLYPLKKAIVWHTKQKNARGYRRTIGNKHLLEYFHRAELIIRRGKKNLVTSIIDDLQGYLMIYEFPDINIIKELRDGVFQTLPIKSLSTEDYKEVIAASTSFLSKHIHVMDLNFEQTSVFLKVYIVHFEEYSTENYYKLLNSILKFLKCFKVQQKVVKIIIMTEKLYYKEHVEASFLPAFNIVKKEFNRSKTPEEKLILKPVIYNTDIARYYQKETLEEDYITVKEEKEIDQVSQLIK